MQAIPQTVFRDVPVVEYKSVAKTVQRPVCRTVMEERPATVYRQVMETKTCDVQSVSYQTVQECHPTCVNRSYWRTVMQPVPKMAACQYDNRPGLLGELNRLGYATRMAFTPNYIPRREFVPNVATVNVPVSRTVAVPTVRQVSYNVARMVPEQIMQKVAVSKIEMVAQEITVMEPFTTTRRMAVGTTYTYAFVDPVTGGTTATAAAPAIEAVPRRADAGGEVNGISSPRTVEPEPTPIEPTGPVAAAPTNNSPVVRTVGWRATRHADAASK
jgi:hypothetical protein